MSHSPLADTLVAVTNDAGGSFEVVPVVNFAPFLRQTENCSCGLEINLPEVCSYGPEAMWEEGGVQTATESGGG